MPSVSNFDTPCGPGQMNFPGMRTDYELLVNSMQPETNQTKRSLHAEPFSTSGSNNIVNYFVPNFHGSSNGYYGYHMVTSADTNNEADSKDECFMDVNDGFGDQGMTSNINKDRLIDDARRKRPLEASSETLPKRSRQDHISDGLHQEGPPPHENRNNSRFDELRRSAVLRRSNKSKSEEIYLSRESSIDNKPCEVSNMKKGFMGSNQTNLELIEILLKETHGCDLYNYRVCDL